MSETISDSRVEELADRTGLSPQRAKVLALLKLRHSKDEIADILDVSPRTVQNHIQDLRAEIKAAQELYDIAGPAHYDDSDYYREFGGELWEFRSGIRYEVNEDKHVEKKIYGSHHGTTLLVVREFESEQGTLTESRKRIEFYTGNDIPHYLMRKNKFDDAAITLLHVALIAGAGIDPIYSPDVVSKDSVSVPDDFEIIQKVIDETDAGFMTPDEFNEWL